MLWVSFCNSFQHKIPISLLTSFSLAVIFFLIATTIPVSSFAMNWTATHYDCSSWPQGQASLGFGKNQVTEINDECVTYYFRKDFYLSVDSINYSEWHLRIRYDDGFVAYINGKEVARRNMPSGDVGYDTSATIPYESSGFEDIDITGCLTDCDDAGWCPLYLSLAVEVHQADDPDVDLVFDAELRADAVTFISPGQDWLYFSECCEPLRIPSDPVTVIQRPLVNMPVIQLPGGSFTIDCIEREDTTGWTATAFDEWESYSLSITPQWREELSRWLLEARLPQNIPCGLYNLRVEADGGVFDETRNAIKVINEFRNSYYFLHVTDSHTPEYCEGYDSGQDLIDLIDDINVINPEFVLHSGDGINRGYYEDQWEIFQRIMEGAQAPVYFVSGNHETGNWCDSMQDRLLFWRYFGWSYLNPDIPGNDGPYTQDYSFDYGNDHYVGLETYRHYIHRSIWGAEFGERSLTNRQFQWLGEDLQAASGSAARVLFYHCDFQREEEPPPDYCSSDLELILPVYGVTACFYGHYHGNEETSCGDTDLFMTGSSVGSGSPSYFRVVRMLDGAIVDHPVLTRSTTQQKYIDVSYSPDNSGQHEIVTATVYNGYGYAFDNAQVEFKVPHNDSGYEVDLGEIQRCIDTGDKFIYVVNFLLPASSDVEVTIHPQWTPTPTVTPTRTPTNPPVNEPPYGHLDGVSATKIFGWGYDPDAGEDPIDVDFYFDGVAGSGTHAATVTANLYRPDVPINVPSVQGDYHGFSWDPSGFIASQGYAPGSVHDVYVYLVNEPSGTNPLLGTGSITVPSSTNQDPYGSLGGASTASIGGWGYDPDAGTSPVDVQIYFDGVAGSGTYAATITANGYRPDVPLNVPSVQGDYHGFNWNPSSFIAGQGYAPGSVHPVYVYLVNQPVGTNLLLGTRSITVPSNYPPYGSLGGVSLTNIFGWGYDPDAGTSPIDVQIYFDGVEGSGTLAATVTAALYRPDVPINVPSVEGDYHGFSWDPTGFIASQGYAGGSVHPVYVYLVNQPAGTNPLLGTGSITVAGTNQDPYGSLGGVSAAKIFGWAYDPDAGTSPIDVEFYFDGPAGSGTYAATVTANIYRPDVPINVPSVQGDYHGFSWDPSGFITSQGYTQGSVHPVYVYLINQPAGTNPLLDTSLITVP